jgi:hypothetical protein
MGDTRNPSALSLEERNFVEVGTFQPSFGFKDFRHAARLHPLAGGHLSLSFKDAYHPCWDRERSEPALYLPHGSAGHLLFQLLVVQTIPQLCGGGVLQPCRGRRTVAAQLGCNIRPLPRFRGEDGSEDLPVRFGAARSLALMSGSRPLSEDANESLPVAASVLGP